MQSVPAYLLVFHGSCDRRPQEAARGLARFFYQRIQYFKLASLVGAKTTTVEPEEKLLFNGNLAIPAFYDADEASSLELNSPSVEVASLEGSSTSLHEQIVDFGHQLWTAAANPALSAPLRIVVLPLFLLQGVHVMEDIPSEVALAQQVLGRSFQVEIAPHLGSHPRLYRLITERMAAVPAEAWILLAHGSRRPNANRAIEALAERLGAVPAYWAVPPDLETRLSELRSLGLRKIAIFPYFLFKGTVTDAIAQQVILLSSQFPGLSLHLTSPLEASAELADLLMELARRALQ
ncbi:sirohydrochlorin chelatase [Leptothermofonsia sp. ETS-13]|uniref:sirohydrochlorin chelatase n=1 Tax=Leptothermofonsia sp. ETS-13 TaxID=3035696 RepID=UPI003BA261DC